MAAMLGSKDSNSCYRKRPSRSSLVSFTSNLQRSKSSIGRAPFPSLSLTMGAAILASLAFFLLLLSCLPSPTTAAPDSNDGFAQQHQRHNFFINGRYGKRGLRGGSSPSSSAMLAPRSSSSKQQGGSLESAAPSLLPMASSSSSSSSSAGPSSPAMMMVSTVHRIQRRSPKNKFYVGTRFGKRAYYPSPSATSSSSPSAPAPASTALVTLFRRAAAANRFHAGRFGKRGNGNSAFHPSRFGKRANMPFHPSRFGKRTPLDPAEDSLDGVPESDDQNEANNLMPGSINNGAASGQTESLFDAVAEPGAPLPFEAGQDLKNGNFLTCIYSGLADLYHCAVKNEESQEDNSQQQPQEDEYNLPSGPAAH